MINLSQANNSKYKYGSTPNNPTVGIMAGTAPAQNTNSFQLPGGVKNPFTGFDQNKWLGIQSQTEKEGRRATIDEYVGAGGNANDYYKIYGGVDQGAYDKIKAQKEGAGGRISLQDYMAVGGNPNEYYKIYGDAPGSVNNNGPYGNVFNQQLNQNYTQAGIDSSLNRINEQNPYGYSNYITNPDGSVSRVSGLSEPNQNLLDQQYWQDSTRGDILGNMMEGYAANYTPLSQDFQGEANRVETQMFDKSMNDINKIYDRDLEARRTQLLNSGIQDGSERYKRAMEEFQANKADAVANARNNAISAGRDQANYLLNQELQRRNQGLSEMAQIQSGIRGPQSPSFSQNYNVQMPYLDTATPNIDAINQQLQWAREDKLRAENKGGGGGGGGGGRGGSNRAQTSYDQALTNMILGYQPQQQSVSPLLQGLSAAGPLLGQALGSYFGS